MSSFFTSGVLDFSLSEYFRSKNDNVQKNNGRGPTQWVVPPIESTPKFLEVGNAKGTISNEPESLRRHLNQKVSKHPNYSWQIGKIHSKIVTTNCPSGRRR